MLPCEYINVLFVIFKKMTDKTEKHFSLNLNSQAQKKKSVQNAKCECSISLTPRATVQTKV